MTINRLICIILATISTELGVNESMETSITGLLGGFVSSIGSIVQSRHAYSVKELTGKGEKMAFSCINRTTLV